MELLHQRLGSQTMVGDLAELGLKDMPQFDPYEDESQSTEIFPALDKELEVSSEWVDQYLNAKILLPKGDMTRGLIVHYKHDANDNPIIRSNHNPILNTCLYEVKFPEGKITELAANMIIESMYGKCDINGNEYLFYRCSLITEKRFSS